MKSTSPHILSTSANLLGFTFLVLTSIRGFGLPQGGLIDEIVAVCVVIFSISTLLSFLSMRAKTEIFEERFEAYADYVFLSGLVIITVVSILFSFEIVTFTN